MTKRLVSKLKKVEVLWNDAWSSYSFYTPDELKIRPMPMLSVGYLVKEDKNGVALAREYTPDGRFKIILVIPRAYIVRKKVLK